MDLTRLSRWIAEHATATDDHDTLLTGFCEALVGAGIPVWRVSVMAPALDPTLRGVSLNWHAGEGISVVANAHGADEENDWLLSPVYALVEKSESFGRWRLDAPGLEADFPVLRALGAQGGVDYILHIVEFAPGTALRGIAVSFCTREGAGFTAAHLAAIADILPFLTLALAKMSLAHTFREVSATYLGRSAAERVLDGQIRRGEGRAVPAAILLTDLRGFTALSDRVDPADMVTWLNAHFDALGDPVARHGGEILKFLGDGFLAIFPVPEVGPLPCPVCGAALDAATEGLAANAALNARRRAAGLPELAAECVVHFGTVIYGNVGTERRLDFTIIGRAVNEASRIESQCAALGHDLLVSDSFAERCARPLKPVGTIELRGLSRPMRIWTVPGETFDGVPG
ncbi:adenylate/guanylate cyclase domain-containing protein [Methylobacterium sp. 2A]|jgi:adenylate cyclase|uniref:adenylate/guanylate cyclase domain-containing protein n=1 Tax=Methylobacterium sp. 2A TaxID=2603816 RepID=UPI001352B371|nr:adenylate/guanylate cyclase domain-containing protein [Methylobacterium sp. 2A]MWV21975.1 adenylate/guanylate cyclase domain-containing protein [Methylobacterium sp. 2A]